MSGIPLVSSSPETSIVFNFSLGNCQIAPQEMRLLVLDDRTPRVNGPGLSEVKCKIIYCHAADQRGKLPFSHFLSLSASYHFLQPGHELLLCLLCKFFCKFVGTGSLSFSAVPCWFLRNCCAWKDICKRFVGRIHLPWEHHLERTFGQRSQLFLWFCFSLVDFQLTCTCSFEEKSLKLPNEAKSRNYFFLLSQGEKKRKIRRESYRNNSSFFQSYGPGARKPIYPLAQLDNILDPHVLYAYIFMYR